VSGWMQGGGEFAAVLGATVLFATVPRTGADGVSLQFPEWPSNSQNSAGHALKLIGVGGANNSNNNGNMNNINKHISGWGHNIQYIPFMKFDPPSSRIF